MTHYWRVRKRLPERFGQRCKIVGLGRMNAVLIEFEDEYRLTESEESDAD